MLAQMISCSASTNMKDELESLHKYLKEQCPRGSMMAILVVNLTTHYIPLTSRSILQHHTNKLRLREEGKDQNPLNSSLDSTSKQRKLSE